MSKMKKRGGEITNFENTILQFLKTKPLQWYGNSEIKETKYNTKPSFGVDY